MKFNNTKYINYLLIEDIVEYEEFLCYIKQYNYLYESFKRQKPYFFPVYVYLNFLPMVYYNKKPYNENNVKNIKNEIDNISNLDNVFIRIENNLKKMETKDY